MVKTIYMGQFDTVHSPHVLKTTLGSCVGVVLYDPVTDTFGLAHIMLPSAKEAGEKAQVGKYADTSIPALIEKMQTPRDKTSRLKAKLAGGANMFSSIPLQGQEDPLRVGERTKEATAKVLQQLAIPILGTDLGGQVPRELTIEAQTGKVWVQPLGGAIREL